MRVLERTVRNSVNTAYGRRPIRRVMDVDYENLRDMLEAKPTGGQRVQHRSISDHRAFNWYGAKSHQDLAHKLKNGWPEMEEKMLGMVKEMKLPASAMVHNINRRRKRRRGDSGNELDIHMVRQGRNDIAWSRMEFVPKERHSNKLVHLFVNVVANAVISSEQQMWRGALALRVYEAMMRAGKNVAITLAIGSYGMWQNRSDELVWQTVPVKTYGQPVMLGKLASMFTGGFWRYYLLEKADYCVPGVTPTPGHGSAADTYDLLPLKVEQERDKGAHVVVIGQCFDKRTADEVLKKFLEQYQNAKASPEAVGQKMILGG